MRMSRFMMMAMLAALASDQHEHPPEPPDRDELPNELKQKFERNRRLADAEAVARAEAKRARKAARKGHT
jgi:hypothetical protein